jgi:thioredoxin 1
MVRIRKLHHSINQSLNLIILFLVMAIILPGCDQNAEKSAAQVSATATVVVPQWNEMLFSQSVGAGKPAFVEFGGSWCIPCQQRQPLLRKLSQQYAGQLLVANVEVREEMNLARSFGVRLIPTQIIFDGTRRVIHSHMGYWPEEQMLATLTELGVIHD